MTAVQVNGKTIYQVEVESGVNPTGMVLSNPEFNDVTILKAVWVPGRLLNLVVGCAYEKIVRNLLEVHRIIK